jgi:hypothetical protein
VNTLSVQAAHLDQADESSRNGEVGYSWLEWVVDGVSLRSRYAHDGAGANQITMLMARDSDDESFRTESLLRLRGDTVAPPKFEPTYHRTRFDRLLHLRGEPIAPAGTALEDGRIGLLFCYCGDLECGALTTRLDVGPKTIEWRDIGWQVVSQPYEPYDPDQEWLGARDLSFDRIQYESLINGLLEADWSAGLPAL